MKKIFLLFSLSSAMLTVISCNRFLDAKSDSLLAVPETLDDNQAILDRYLIMGLNPVSAEISADDFYLSESNFNTMGVEAEKRLHTWEPDYVSGSDWKNVYNRINIFNNVLFNIEHYKIPMADNVKGQALVWRAGAYLEAAQIWCLAYDPATADQNLGLPLRLNPDMNIPSVRSTLRQTYSQILTDLHAALPLLPQQQIAASRPSKVTALGFLSRAYLFMGDYANALKYGLQALEINNQLMNFNTLNPTTSYPVPDLNVEVLLPTSMSYNAFLTVTTAKIPETLYESYHENDLRKSIFFRKDNDGAALFRGNYGGSSTRKNCLAVDELYLIVAESYARLNKPEEAISWLNSLLVTRWKTGTYIPISITDSSDALIKIRTERRKELLFRGLRWADLKRYNKEGAAITLTRTFNGKTYTLPPNDLRYAIAIPEEVIEMTGMPQNPR